MPYLAATGLASILTTSAFTFKLAFTAEDAPELNVGFAKALHESFQGQSLLLRARIVFVLLVMCISWAVYRSLAGSPSAAANSGKLQPLVTNSEGLEC